MLLYRRLTVSGLRFMRRFRANTAATPLLTAVYGISGFDLEPLLVI